ncbi:hypothetical protein ElyMa_005417000 [Elysia marginata]|uniref:Uncharacterized protein n=1 Tax=Elysia marginata TaxID=1093978 RepID=A0AAV4EJ88_9GAST|nr:hypothetical protein ElyMa_005417000 [Elysia marginata]
MRVKNSLKTRIPISTSEFYINASTLPHCRTMQQVPHKIGNYNCNAHSDKDTSNMATEQEKTVTLGDSLVAVLLHNKNNQALFARLQKIRETRTILREKASMLLTWNIIQLLVLLLMFMYASSCHCNFRKLFSCSNNCLRKNHSDRSNL